MKLKTLQAWMSNQTVDGVRKVILRCEHSDKTFSATAYVGANVYASSKTISGRSLDAQDALKTLDDKIASEARKLLQVEGQEE